jgi:hypothetical protein
MSRTDHPCAGRCDPDNGERGICGTARTMRPQLRAMVENDYKKHSDERKNGIEEIGNHFYWLIDSRISWPKS